MKMISIKFYLGFMALLFAGLSFAQVTTGAFSGDVLDADGFGLADAEVSLVHEPTGTVYRTVTDADGYFNVNNARIGGPYRIEVSAEGFNSFSRSGLSVQLGQTTKYTAQMNAGVDLEEVVITGAGDPKFKRSRTGSETTIDRELLEALPNSAGGLGDFVRITPQARVDEQEISIAGQNNRFNSVYIDGAVDNDVFGLSDSGLDGGQSGLNPFAFDELDQISVSVAPYDVRQSGFAGGAINATTRGGTNELHGSAYWFARNETLAGRQAVPGDGDRAGLPEFNADRYGFSLGGPIMKDKLFFFATFEREEVQTPRPFIDNYVGTTPTQAFYDYLSNNFNYNPGSFGSISDNLRKDILATRLDWNITNNHSLSLKYKFQEGQFFDAATSNTRVLNFSDRSIIRPNKKHQIALDLNSNWTDKLSTKLLVTYKNNVDDREPAQAFPTITLEDNGGEYRFGSEFFSTANFLEQDVFGLIGNISYDLGNHNLLAGVQYDYFDVTNVFIRGNYGSYEWNNDAASGLTGVQRFLNGENADFFLRQFSLIDGDTVGNNNTGAAAAFSLSMLGFLLQDEWRVNRDLTVTAGVRIDMPFFEDTRLNEAFNETIPDYIAAGYDLHGARTGQSIDTQVLFSPRVGFNWTPELFADAQMKTQIRGGIGVFTSRNPLVWIGGAYNNTGNTIAEVSTGDVPFNPDITTNQGLTPGSSRPQIDLFASDLKPPQRLKVSLGFDQKLPLGFTFTTEYQYDDVLNDFVYQNVNIRPAGTFTGADNRTRWNSDRDSQFNINQNFGEVLVGSNTSQGYAHTYTVGFSNDYIKNLFFNFNYTFNDAYSLNDATSSQNSSQWNNNETVNGKNTPTLQRADYALGSRLTAVAAYTFNWDGEFSKARTKISAFYEGVNGEAYSYVYGEGGNGSTRILNDDRSRRDATLIYVPRDISEINLAPMYNGLTADQQWAALDAFIERDRHLRERRGEYAEANGSRQPWSHIVDVRLLQEFDFDIFGKTNTLGFYVDIFNFTNLINRNWGTRYVPPFRGHQLIDVVNVTDNGNNTYTATYGVDVDALTNESIDNIDNSGIQSSVWQLQFGVRYSF